MGGRYAEGSLGWWMDRRRGELGFTWLEAAECAGVSDQTFYRAARGRQLRTPNKMAIERALKWASGSVDAILSGGEPTPLTSEHKGARGAVTDSTHEDPGSRGWWIDEQRIALDKDWGELAIEAGISNQALYNIRRGGDMRRKTKRRLEAALGWAEGSLDAIDSGGQPTPLASDPSPSEPLPPGPLPDYPPELYERVLRDDVEEGMWTVREASEDGRWIAILQRRHQLWRDSQS